MSITRYTETQYGIFRELCESLSQLGGDGLLPAIGSLGDTLSDQDVLGMIQDWNRALRLAPRPVSNR